MTNCKNCGQDFQIESEDLAFYSKMKVPSPTHCPDCRLQRRFTWRNDRNLYERTCDHSGEKIISMYAPDAPTTVYHSDIWWGDKWDAIDFGRDYDFSKPFFEQFAELNREVPHPHLLILHEENSKYTNYNTSNKNCYICFAGNYSEDCYYCYNAQHCKDCVDCLFIWNSELCHECAHVDHCYGTRFAVSCRNCTDCFFIEDCMGCSDCFMCFGLKRTKYHILNKAYSKEDYERILKSFALHTRSGWERAKGEWIKARPQFPKRKNHNLQTEDCVGDYILQSKNCKNCHIMAKGCEDCKYVYNGFPLLKDSYDCTYCGEKAALQYECLASGVNQERLTFGNLNLEGCYEVHYSQYLMGCKDCFGCDSLHKKQYCILNKQYTKEQYEELLPRVIEHMKSTGEYGEFFPIAISPFAYNESGAQELFPLTKEETLAKGYRWREKDPKEYQPQQMKVPDDLGQVEDSICEQVLACQDCGKNYRIIPQELRFLRKQGAPVPVRCFECRHKARRALMTPHPVHQRKCAKCDCAIQTTYSPEGPEMVYCQSCYLAQF